MLAPSSLSKEEMCQNLELYENVIVTGKISPPWTGFYRFVLMNFRPGLIQEGTERLKTYAPSPIRI